VPAPTETVADRQRARLARWGTWPAVLAVLVAAVVVASALSVPILSVLLGPEGSGTSAEVFAHPAAVVSLLLLQDLILLGSLWLLLIRPGVTSWRDMGLIAPGAGAAILRGLGWGLLFIMVSTGLQILLGMFGLFSEQAQQFPLREAGPAGRVAIWLTGVLFVPVIEEIFFRGYVFRAMSLRKGAGKGLIYSSLLFAALHLDWADLVADPGPQSVGRGLALLVPITVGAMILAVAYRRSGRLLTSITAHALNNAFAFTLIMLGSDMA